MAFVLTLIYVALSLLSPSVLPTAIVAMHVNIILGIATILVLLPRISGSGASKLPDTYLIIGLLFAAVLSVVHLGFSEIPGTVAGFVPILIVYYFVLIGCRTPFHLKLMVFVLFGVGLYIFAQGALADHYHEVMSPYLETEGTGQTLVFRYKGLGVLSDPNDLAEFFAMVIPLLWIRWKPGSYVANLLFTILPALALATGMYFTHSRGGVIALMAIVLFGFKDRMGVVLSSILAAGLFLGLVALNVGGNRGMNEDDGGRVAAWITGLEIFKSHPFVGVGIGHFSDFNDTGHTAHNSYVLVLSEVGILGYFCWMGSIVTNLNGLGKISRSKPTDGSVGEEAEVASRYPALAFRNARQEPRRAPAFGPAATLAISTPGAAGLNFPGGGSSGGPWSPSPMRIGEASAPANPNSDAALVYMAKVLRVSFIGLLTSAFFLSRSFSMVFYVLLGMSASLRVMYENRHPEIHERFGPIAKRIWIVIFCSIIFLYVFVRVRGLH
jgi:O-antigen ligase